MKRFSGPIPGQSLTGTPKGHPWERPPEINDPEEAILMHISRLSQPDMLNSVLDLIELEEIDINTMVKGIMRGAVSSGVHSIDVGLIVAPVVHEFIKQAAMASGIAAEDGFEDKGAKEQQRQYAIAKRAKKMLREMGVSPKEILEEAPAEEPAMGVGESTPMEAMPQESAEVMTEEAPKGLMARGAM